LNLGGPLVTASGLMFIGATPDRSALRPDRSRGSIRLKSSIGDALARSR
jgi:hypothetical protein